jgi:hypothetical protein
MAFNSGFDAGFYTGAASQTALVPALYDMALSGRPFLIDRQMDGRGQFRHVTIPLLRPQTQTSDKLGESSINPAGLWRSSVENWMKGAGQTAYDLADSDPDRFRSSKGIDPWTRWELSLLPATDQKIASANTNLQLLPVGDYLYLVDGTALKFTQDITVGSPSWTTVTGTSGSAITSIATDGYQVYVTDGTAIYITARGGATAASWNTQDADLLGFAKGRLMASNDALAFNILTSSTKTDIVDAADIAAGTDWDWTGFASGRSCIYMSGFSGDKSLIYRTAVKADGTALDAGTVAGELPDGEIVRTIYGYLGFLLIGTDNGIRLATADDNGDLTIGALIETTAAVRCFEGQDRFVWFGWTNYDGTSTGLGRLDLTVLNGSAPAYASDLMATVQGAVLSVVTFQGRRVFTVSGQGVFGEETTPVSTGTIDFGEVSFGIPDRKIALAYDVRHDPLDGAIVVALSADSGAFSNIGTLDTADSTGTELPIGETLGERFETRLTLTPTANVSPVVTRVVLSTIPTADTGFMIVCPVMLNEIDEMHGGLYPRDVAEDLTFIEELRASRDVVLYQELGRAYGVTLEDYEFLPTSVTSDRRSWQGTAILSLKVV